ncbi:MAG: SpoIIE family protein phosphatase [Flavobacteriales bacterium]|nr:SpoIIE family protein phosphatase [Flavobacteriales bacterium]
MTTFSKSLDSQIFESLMEGFQVIGFDWTYLYINEVAARHGKSTREELTGQDMREMYPGIETTELFRQMKYCMETRTATRFENHFQHNDGTQEWFHICISPVSEGLFVLSLDITETKLAAQKLQKANDSLEETVKIRTSELVEKNKEITDNLQYAKRIQDVMLPNKNEFFQRFPDAFILYKPKDIVSGDFYYMHTYQDTTYLAAADCTGHGVSGALMSMIGHEKLCDSLIRQKNTGTILSTLNQGIRRSLRQSEGNYSTLDGMDIALCAINHHNKTLQYSGAKRPLWIIRKDSQEVEMIKATRQSIGGLTAGDQCFETHTIQLNPGDCFYIFSDGYADALSKCGKRIKAQLFRKLLLKVSKRNMREQKKLLDRFVQRWISGFEQLDDMLVIGVRV